MSERRRATQLACGNPPIRLTPLPTGSGSTLQPFPQIRGGHRINVDADILSEESARGSPDVCLRDCCKRLQTLESPGKDLRRRAQARAYSGHESCHVVEFALTKKQHVAAGGEKRIDATGISGAGSAGVKEAPVRQKKPAGTDLVSPRSFSSS